MPRTAEDIRNRLLVVRLPALPNILVKLIEYCRTERVGLDQLAELIAKDPAIAGKIVGVANSAAFRRGGQKFRLEQSLMTLGTDMIRTLVISESVVQTFNHFTTSASINLCKFWEHSLTNAVLAREIARKTGYQNIDEAYLCGLLHDVGRIAFLAVTPTKYTSLFQEEDSRELCNAELEALQITHSEAGAWMADRWKLGQHVADSILFHHEPASRIEKTSPLVRLTYLAHVLSCNPYDAPAVREAASLCSLTIEDLKPMQEGAEQKVKESAEFLGVDITQGEDSVVERSRAQYSSVQKQLKDELHYIVQESETERSFARQTSEPALLKTIGQSAHILFDIQNPIVLMLDPSGQVLSINPNIEYQQQLAGFTLRVKRDSAIADAIIGKSPAFVTKSAQPISEEPLMKLLEADTMLCLPLVTGNNCLGILAGKVSPAKISDLQENARFMQVFATQAASALVALRQRHEEMRSLATNAVDEFLLASRKIAHEANNPLTVIKNYLSVLNEKLRKQQPVGGEITILNEEIDRVSRIIQKFANPQPTTVKEITNVNQIIDDISRMMRDSGFAPPSVNIITRFNKLASETDCDDGKIWQILLNLLKNAIEAMQNGGEITIANQGHVNHNGRLYINLLIRDTGTGLPKEVLEKLFSPVATTKSAEHQGLGLSIVQDLAKDLNGFISCRSGSTGTTFEILLPVRSVSSALASPSKA